ncbi:ferrous iron transport protein B [Arcticibacter tournemirensis]|uniref:ferrous iron transport protein B n=1 Tax=Arcticibacter tournemirensis TaxID=699437 RepID=UPI00117212C4|nr:ferrous iron transport protein B [Arcticibacter tournemirensis]TQM47025.1 ferrous iron transport protein B [Arcticibacter tournemirensis]
MNGDLKVALVGNPNTGKSTLFNILTGLNQKIGNFPGITVDKKTGNCRLSDGRNAVIIDLPGTYSLYPKSKDETIVFEVLADKNNDVHPDLVIIVSDASNLKRNLLLYTQVADMKIPVVIALNMMDLARKSGTHIDIDALSTRLGVQVVPISARQGENIEKLKEAIQFSSAIPLQNETIKVESIAPGLISKIQEELLIDHPYAALQLAHQHENLRFLSSQESDRIEEIEQEFSFHSQKAQASETIERYNFINSVLKETVRQETNAVSETVSNKIDKVLTHKVWGFLIFFVLLFVIFQSIFAWSEYPMSLIESLFVWLTESAHNVLPPGVLTDLLTDGVIAGLSGVLVFIPQIAILFAFISVLEDTGYMSRVTFMLDKVMRKVGLSGKSVVPMIGGLACAVPSIMSTRNIENWKDRMITIMVTPLVSCSARLPIYTVLISLVVPDKKVAGLINLQGVALMAMYVISIITAIFVAWVMKYLLRAREKGYFIMELPVYRLPRWDNVLLTMYEKVKTFVVEAGKVIIAISIVLWVLATYGPPGKHAAIEKKYSSAEYINKYSPDELELHRSSELLETSFAGVIGKAIEPAIVPLGYDWKIGIALITSFAAREVFVGTMATIYSVNNDDSHISSVTDKMRQARNPETGLPVFTLASSFSLMIFYAFAMQCMSTLAVVYRETKSWKWPLIQFAYMTALAYIASFIVFNLLK